jgi:hypothetical protein
MKEWFKPARGNLQLAETPHLALGSWFRLEGLIILKLKFLIYSKEDVTNAN